MSERQKKLVFLSKHCQSSFKGFTWYNSLWFEAVFNFIQKGKNNYVNIIYSIRIFTSRILMELWSGYLIHISIYLSIYIFYTFSHVLNLLL